VPQIQRSVGIVPLLLADNSEYTLGLARETSRPERVAACHAAYLDVMHRCTDVTGEPAMAAVMRFLTAAPELLLDLPEDFDRGAAITFRVHDGNGTFPADISAVQAFWAGEHDPGAKNASVMQCIVCGHERPVLDRLQAKIKGVPGGQTSGTAIISANSKAFESYGLEASLVAPTCADCGEKFTKALNWLLSDEAHRISLGGAVFIFWTRTEVSFNFRTLLADPKPEDVRQLVASVNTGTFSADLDDTPFYATVLSGSGGRTVVRDWIDTTVGTVRNSLARWFERQRIVDVFGAEMRPLGLYSLAAATVRESKDLSPPALRMLLRGALFGAPLQRDVLYRAIRRNHAEQRVTRPRASLIKLVLLSGQQIAKEGYMVGLDLANTSPAYRCGRLLAVLEDVQRLAIPGIKATIVDRFFGTASSAPVAVFPRLIRGAQPHLAKLKRDARGAYVALDRRLEEILDGLSQFPRVLTLDEQGWFALGYYHQRAYDHGQAREASARRAAGASATQPQTDAQEVSDEFGRQADEEGQND